MPNTQEADKRLVAWLKERTDPQLERIMEAPEDGLTWENVYYDPFKGTKCLAGWAFDMSRDRSIGTVVKEGVPNEALQRAIKVHRAYDSAGLETREAMARIKAYVAAELLARRVNRKRLPAPQASVDPVNEAYALEAEV